MLRGKGGKIRAPRRGLNKDEVDFDATWTVLSTAFRQIHAKNASTLSYEELFRNAYKLVLKKKVDMLFDKVCELEENYLKDDVRRRVRSQITPSIVMAAAPQSTERMAAGERFMRELKDSFKDFQLCIGLITDVLMYMYLQKQDRVNSQDNRRPSIFATAMILFRAHVLKATINDETAFDVLSLLESVMLDMIKMERRGEVIDRALLRACSYMLEGLYESVNEDESTKLYSTSFEPKFLEASRVFYREEGQSLLAQGDARTFCHNVRKRLREEDERCQQSISPISEPKIKEVVDRELIQAHIRDVINMPETGLQNMLDNDRIEDLRNLYELIARVDPKKSALRDGLQKRVVQLGEEINKAATIVSDNKGSTKQKAEDDKSAPEKQLNAQTQAAITWVEQILQLKAKYDKFWEVAFAKDTVIEKAIEVSFQEFINTNSRSPEHLSLFLDEYLKQGGKGKTEAETDSLLDKGVLLSQYLADKDMFETYYKKHMAKRLLLKRSSRDMERQVLSKMKIKIGNQFTQKLESLIKDMDNSETLNHQYKEYVNKLGDPDPNRIDMEASILTTTVWPVESQIRANADGSMAHREYKYPVVLDRAKMRFEKFYHDKHNGRKLTWLASMGTADIRATFRNAAGKIRRYELNVSTPAMLILMLFNDLAPGQSLSFEEIEAETNIPSQDLVRNLQSLSLVAKWRLLRKEPSGKDVKPTDRFLFNEEFSSQFLKIKIAVVSNTANRLETGDELKETKRKADEERGHIIDAAIVRIMKSRKTLSHPALMTETIQQLSQRFKPDVNMIKKKIETLIDREYLERGPDPAKPSYVYLA